MLCVHPLGPVSCKQHILGPSDRGRRVGAQPVVDADGHVVDEAEEDRVAGGDAPARVYEPGTDVRAVPEADLLFVGCAGRDGSAGGARERDQAQNEKRHGGHSRRGEERTEVERALISRAIHDWDLPGDPIPSRLSGGVYAAGQSP